MTLMEKERCLRLNDRLSKGLWAITLNMACHLVNRSPQTSLDRKVTEEVWTCNPIDLNNLMIFGCPSFMHIFSEDRSKLDPSQNNASSLAIIKGSIGPGSQQRYAFRGYRCESGCPSCLRGSSKKHFVATYTSCTVFKSSTLEVSFHFTGTSSLSPAFLSFHTDTVMNCIHQTLW
ncbi:unnamed protein product [Vicia faba]|uniref:Uncharacterized protein n=1 Tax=Vicia faba TaxID=3906 RepID=A0AAV0YVR4_VICFA|nr:unnamed protein product [Vicia faba]